MLSWGRLMPLCHSFPWKQHQTPSIRSRLWATETFEHPKIATLFCPRHMLAPLANRVMKMKMSRDRNAHMCLGTGLTRKAKSGQSHRHQIQQSIKVGKIIGEVRYLKRFLKCDTIENLRNKWLLGEFSAAALPTQAYLLKTLSNTCFVTTALQNNSFCYFLLNLPSCFSSLGTNAQPRLPDTLANEPVTYFVFSSVV